ncbi:MAG: hypothetical protein O9330_12275 [Beijerinckiaceae bacterium]|jgi:hypothetical protein|nr:hypothetical protein [Beijerinckiaceae bacterium]
MSKLGTTIRSSRSGQFVTARSHDAPRAKVKFGDVTISGTKPSAEVVKVNVERSSLALERVAKKLMSPGVTIRPKKGVPQYSVADGEAGVFIRKLDGRVERGRVVGGVFKVID